MVTEEYEVVPTTGRGFSIRKRMQLKGKFPTAKVLPGLVYVCEEISVESSWDSEQCVK